MPGYIKDVPGNEFVAGTHKRMRFVQPGYDVDTAPPNKVILDSDDQGTLSLLYAGIFRFNRDGPAAITRQVASWSLSYIPLCTFQFRPYNDINWNPCYVPAGPGTNITAAKMLVSRTGISCTLLVNGPEYVDIAWQAYRLVVA